MRRLLALHLSTSASLLRLEHELVNLREQTFVAFRRACKQRHLTTQQPSFIMAAAVNNMLDEVEDFVLPPRKKPKVSELPLSSAQRASIDGMLHTFKKKGDFDALRKKAFQQYNESAQRGMFEAALRKFTSDEIEREPVKYLKPDRRLAAPLLEGAAARANVYDKSQADVDNYIEQYLANAEVTLRDIRRKEIGEAAAAEEVARGTKSEETYAAEAETRRKDRAKKHADEEKLRLKKEAQERKKKEIEALKKKQEELMKETERLQREQKRRQEREEWKKAEKEREKERIQKFNEEREKQKKEAEEREKAAQVDREKRQKEKEQRDKERLEQEALELLLREGRAMTDRARRPELERSESMEPPPRLRHNAPNTNLSKEEMRARGLMPTSLTLRKGDKPDTIPTGPRAAAPTIPYDDEIRKRNSRLRSPSPTRSTQGRREPASSSYPDDRRPSRRDDSRDYPRESSLRDRRESYYRDVDPRRRDDRLDRDRERDRPREREQERERERERERDNRDKGEEGEVVERPSARPRSRSRESYRRRESPRRTYRERSRTRSPRRRRSRSPAGIDRYVPGGGGGPPAPGGGGGRDRGERDRRDRSRERERYRERGEGDRYVPGRNSERDEPDRNRRRERSRSRDRERRRERSREGYRERDRERDRARD